MLRNKLLIFTIIFVSFSLSSLIYSENILNANVFYKKFFINFLISLFPLVYILLKFKNNKILKIGLNIVDIVIIANLLYYLTYLFITKSKILNHFQPVYFVTLYFFLRIFLTKTRKENIYNVLFTISPVIILIHIVIVIMQKINIFPCLHELLCNGSTFGNPDALGTYMALFLPFCLFKFGYNLKIIRYFICIIILPFLLYIQARTALIGITLSLFFWLIKNKFIRIFSIKFFLISIIIILILIVVIYINPSSFYGRVFIWFLSFSMIKEKPLGWGIYAFDKYYPIFQGNFVDHFKNFLNIFPVEIVHTPYNEFLYIGVSFGIFGLSLFGILLSVIIFSAVRSDNLLIYPLLILFASTMCFFPFKIFPLISFVIIIISIISSEKSNIINLRIENKLLSIVVFIISFFYILFLLYKTIDDYFCFRYWQNAFISLQENKLHNVEKTFHKIYPKMKYNGRFLITYAHLKYKQKDLKKSLILFEESKNFYCDSQQLLKIANLYSELNNEKLAIDNYQLAIKIDPLNYNIHYEYIRYLIKLSRYLEAYNESLKLYNKPLRKTIYIDQIIIKKRLLEMIKEYEEKKIITQSF